MALTPIVELGVAEAYDLLTRHFGVTGLPPLEAIENEDWGRDSLLGRFQDFPADALAVAGLTWDEDDSHPLHDPPGEAPGPSPGQE